MNEFFINIWGFISSLYWFDLIVIVIIVNFFIIGFKNSIAKELTNSFFTLLAFILAWIFNNALAQTFIITWLTASSSLQAVTAFITILVIFFIFKKALYATVNKISTIDEPCVLNKVFALLVLITIVLILSWQYTNIINKIVIINAIVKDETVPTILSYIVVFSLIIGFCALVSKIFSININYDNPCLLKPFFQKILDNVQTFNNLLNAHNSKNSIKNKLLGGLIAIIKGFLFILIIVLILQYIGWQVDNRHWTEAENILKILQYTALKITPWLLKYVLFI